MTDIIQPQRNIVDKPFVYGSAAFKIDSGATAEGHSHRWTVYIRGLDNEDMSTYIDHVTFILHNTYTNPNRIVYTAPYEVTETGWGEFDINIIIQFRDNTNSTLQLSHHLKLFPSPVVVNGQTIEHDSTQPVMSEHYDEFVFVNPSNDFITRLNQSTNKITDQTILTQYFTTQQFATDEQKSIEKLQSALNKLAANIHVQRVRLYSIQQDIQLLEA